METILRFTARVLQFLSAFIMALVLILFVMAALPDLETLGPIGSMITDRNIPQILYISLICGFIFFCAAELIWILTRRKFAEESRIVTLDTGRGITAFILVFVLCIASVHVQSAFAGSGEVRTGIMHAADTLLVNRKIIMELSAGGLLISSVRKLIGR